MIQTTVRDSDYCSRHAGASGLVCIILVWYDKNGISFSATTDEVNEAIDFLLQYFDADSLMSKQLGIYNQSGASTGIEGLKCAGFVHSGSTYVSMI